MFIFSLSLLAIGVWMIILGLLTLVVVYFLWNGKKIGWYLVMIYLVINAITGIISLPGGILNLLLTIVLIWYFFRPNVREFFGV
jgi:hypothetical protein